MTIITDSKYIGNTNAIVDKDEYDETRNNIGIIKADSQRYVDEYIDFMMKRSTKYDPKEFARIYQYSTLKYFHNKLGITDNKDAVD